MKQNLRNFIDFLKRKSYTAIFPDHDEDVSIDMRKGASDFLTYNDISLYVNRAIDKRAEKVGEIQFVLKKGDTKIERNPLIDLLNKPNKFHTGKQFWKLYQKYKDLTGSAFIYLESSTELFNPNKVSAMHLLRPDRVKVLFDEAAGEITGFEYDNGTGKPTIYSAEEVLYSFDPDPMNPIKGVSLLRSGIMAIETGLQLSQYQLKILKNGGKIDGVFKFKTGNLTKTQVAELKEQYKDQYATAQKSGIPLFLAGDADYERLSLNPEELSYLTSKNVNLDDICILTGVPRTLLANMSDIKFDNADASITVFLRETIKPLLTDLATFLDWRFIPEGMDLEFIDPTPENVDQKIALLEAGSNVNATTLNERRKMLGLEPMKEPEADKLMVPFSLSPIGSDPAPAAQANKFKSADFQHPLKDPFFRTRYKQLMVKRMDRRESKLLKAMQAYFKDQQARIVSSVDGAKRFRVKNLIDSAFNHTLEAKLAKGTVLPILEQIIKESGADAFQLLGSDFEFHLSGEINSWLDKRASLFADEITATTYDKLKAQFQESLDAGESRQDLVKRIEGTYDGFSDGRARVIARTEVHGATTKGTLEGYKQAGAPIKIWVAVQDENTREAHSMADGQEVPINQPFDVGGEAMMYPGDPSASPENTINCRCAI
jgi:HK97 family phage portal protein